MQIMEVVRHCKYCNRESTVPAMEWEENPYCHHCLKERLEAGKARRGNVLIAHVGNYAMLIPTAQRHS